MAAVCGGSCGAGPGFVPILVVPNAAVSGGLACLALNCRHFGGHHQDDVQDIEVGNIGLLQCAPKLLLISLLPFGSWISAATAGDECMKCCVNAVSKLKCE